MPCTDVVSFQFLIPLCIGWQVLFGIGAVHGFLRRDSRHSSRGWQLYAAVVVILGVLAIESLLQLILAAVFHGDETLVTNFFGYVRLLFCSLSDSLFIALLLAISGGYWYVVEVWGLLRCKCFLVKHVFLIHILQLTCCIMHPTASLGRHWDHTKQK